LEEAQADVAKRFAFYERLAGFSQPAVELKKMEEALGAAVTSNS
jgi:hypothetical protein